MKYILDTNADSALMKGAAHALARGAVLVTANVDDRIRVQGLVVEDWSAAA